MIPVFLAPEPATFDARIRQKGKSALQELIGGGPSIRRRGRLRKKVADRVEDIAPEMMPLFWQDCLPELHQAYGGICAYSCMYIDLAVGGSTVDHFEAKSRRPDLAYEWQNYRLASTRMNSRKGNRSGVLDPFAVQKGWFCLEFVAFQVFANPDCPSLIRSAIEETIRILGLCDELCCNHRREYYELYAHECVTLDYLRQRCPLVASEIVRQGLQRRSMARADVSSPAGSAFQL